MMKNLTDLPEKKLSGIGETDERHVRAGSRGIRLETPGGMPHLAPPSWFTQNAGAWHL